ncbi:MAG: hypothetical protein M0Z53_14990 [Thermaerobacter sp.]|nr:hypothetical protein [Thermaerobacter sp.]
MRRGRVYHIRIEQITVLLQRRLLRRAIHPAASGGLSARAMRYQHLLWQLDGNRDACQEPHLSVSEC